MNLVGEQQGTAVAPGETPKSSSRALGPGWVVGGLCDDPMLRYTGTGKSLARCRLAVSERKRDEVSGQWVEGEVKYVDVTVWGRQAEHVAEHLRKGDRVIAAGYWNEEKWLGQDGQWHESRTLTARDMGPSLMWKPARVIRGKEGSEEQ